MELQEVKTIKEKDRTPHTWEDKVELRLTSKQFPAIKGVGTAKNIKMVIEGEVTKYSKDSEKDEESYTILVKKAGVEKKDSRQIKENQGGSSNGNGNGN